MIEVVLRGTRWLRLAVAALGLGIVLMAIWAPISQTVSGVPAGETIYSTLAAICHQYPSRSFWITDRPLALCVRCCGGYLGVALGGALSNRLQRVPIATQIGIGLALFAVAVFEPLAQVNLQMSSPWPVRFASGLLGGFGVVTAILPVSNLNRSTRRRQQDEAKQHRGDLDGCVDRA